jgi:cytochrome c oxidase subunit 2
MMVRPLLALFAASTVALEIVTFAAPPPVRIVAERFAFTPSRVEIEAGDEVEFVLTSDDTSHGFHIVGSSIDAVIPRRGSGDARVRITLDEPGRYTFECSRMCGAGHGFMRGELLVRAKRGGAAER